MIIVNFGPVVFAQNCLNILNSNSLYYNSKEIINGTKWNSEKKYSGSPLLEKNYWPKAAIFFDGKLYRDIQMNYDIVLDEIIIYSPEKGSEKYVVINKEKLSEFTYADSLTQQKRTFQRIELPSIKGSALYEKIPLEKIQLFIKPIKDLKINSSETNAGTLTDSYRYFLDIGNGFESFSSKRQLLKLLTNHKTEMNKYIKKEHLKINNKHPEDTILAIRYFEKCSK